MRGVTNLDGAVLLIDGRDSQPREGEDDVSRRRADRYGRRLMSQYFASMFRRRPNEGWFRVGNYDVTTVDILCSLAIVTMFVYGILGASTFERLTFQSFMVRENLELWRIVTWPVATVPDFFPLLGVVFFWVFGQQLEALFGRGKFVAWVTAVTIVPALVLTGLGYVSKTLDFTNAELGLHVLFLGGIWVYAATYPNVRWFEIVPLWALAAIFTVLDLLQLNGAGARGAVVFLLVALAVALSAGRSLGLASAWPIPHIPLGAAGSGGTSSRRSKPSKPKRPKRGGSGQTVVDGPWRKAGGAPFPPPPSGPPMASTSDQVELDGLLDKIGASGMDSLSGAEKQRLNELSKRLRNR
jgi:hypothetical protein